MTGAATTRGLFNGSKKRLSQSMPRRVVLRNFQSPGDIVMMTAMVRDLKYHYPRLEIDVRTSCPALWEHNPHIVPLDPDDDEVEVFESGYPLINRSNDEPWHFLNGFIEDAQRQLGLPFSLTTFRGDVHLSEAERAMPSPLEEFMQRACPFWIIVAGGKFDLTTKWWNPESYQKVVDSLRNEILFVQCGSKEHWHPPLRGVVNLVGRGIRDFVRLMYHADGVLCPVTFAAHLAAAVETRPGKHPNRPCVVIAGGREPPHWEAYPHHQFLHTVGALDCCSNGGCWRSRCHPDHLDGPGSEGSLCKYPVPVSSELYIARCMTLITPEDVVNRIRLYYSGGVLAPDPLKPEFYTEAETRLRQGL